MFDCALGHNEGGYNSPGAESLWWRRKVPTMLQALSSTAHLLPKDLKFEHGGAKLSSCPGRHLTSLRPWLCGKHEWKYENSLLLIFEVFFCN